MGFLFYLKYRCQFPFHAALSADTLKVASFATVDTLKGSHHSFFFIYINLRESNLNVL